MIITHVIIFLFKRVGIDWTNTQIIDFLQKCGLLSTWRVEKGKMRVESHVDIAYLEAFKVDYVKRSHG